MPWVLKCKNSFVIIKLFLGKFRCIDHIHATHELHSLLNLSQLRATLWLRRLLLYDRWIIQIIQITINAIMHSSRILWILNLTEIRSLQPILLIRLPVINSWLESQFLIRLFLNSLQFQLFSIFIVLRPLIEISRLIISLDNLLWDLIDTWLECALLLDLVIHFVLHIFLLLVSFLDPVFCAFYEVLIHLLLGIVIRSTAFFFYIDQFNSSFF